VSLRESGDGSAKMLFSLRKLSAAQMPEPHGIVAATVARVTAQRFAPIDFWTPRGMAILFEMHPCEIQLIGAGYFARRSGFSSRRRTVTLRQRCSGVVK